MQKRKLLRQCQADLVEAICAVIAERDRWRNAREELKAEAMDQFSVEFCVQLHAEVLTRAAASAASSG